MHTANLMVHNVGRLHVLAIAIHTARLMDYGKALVSKLKSDSVRS